MGNLLACCPTPKKGNGPETSKCMTLTEHWLCDGLSTFKLTTTIAVAPGGGGGGCDDPNPTSELRDKIEHSGLNDVKELTFDGLKQRSLRNAKKKVTFDLSIRTHEASTSCKDACTSQNGGGDCEKVIGEKIIEEEERIPTYPSDHRYQNCSRSNDEDFEKSEEEDKDVFYDYNDKTSRDGTGGCHQEEESSDSLFSLQLDKDWQTFSEIDSSNVKSASSPHENEVLSINHSVCERGDCVQNVLKPMENLSRWREGKATKAASKHPNKENIDQSLEARALSGARRSSKQSAYSSRNSRTHNGNEVSVEASFSSWLQMPQVNSIASSQDKSDSQSKSSSGSCTSSTLNDHPISSALAVDGIEIWRLQSNGKLPAEMSSREISGTYSANQGGKLEDSSTMKGRPRKYEKDKIIIRHSIQSK